MNQGAVARFRSELREDAHRRACTHTHSLTCTSVMDHKGQDVTKGAIHGVISMGKAPCCQDFSRELNITKIRQ